MRLFSKWEQQILEKMTFCVQRQSKPTRILGFYHGLHQQCTGCCCCSKVESPYLRHLSISTRDQVSKCLSRACPKHLHRGPSVLSTCLFSISFACHWLDQQNCDCWSLILIVTTYSGGPVNFQKESSWTSDDKGHYPLRNLFKFREGCKKMSLLIEFLH